MPAYPTVRPDAPAFDDALARMEAAARERRGFTIVLQGGSPQTRQDVLTRLSDRLSTDVHQVDAGGIVGERPSQTQGLVREKFDAAPDEATLLYFDDADALFHQPGDRQGEDALHAYDYFFERVEAYHGVVVLCLSEPGNVERATGHGVDLVVTL